MTDIKEKVLHWLATGWVGESSKAMAFCISDVKCGNKRHPLDPDDLNRCILFLKAVPEAREHFGKIRLLSETWRNMIDRWDELEQLFIDEVGLNWSKGYKLHASKTYELMRDIREMSSKAKAESRETPLPKPPGADSK